MTTIPTTPATTTQPNASRYTVIVQDGEIVDRDLRALAPAIRHSCGHDHKSLAAAEQCQRKLVGAHCEACGQPSDASWPCREHQSRIVCSATWYNSDIHEHEAGSMDYLAAPPMSPEEIAAEEAVWAEREAEGARMQAEVVDWERWEATEQARALAREEAKV